MSSRDPYAYVRAGASHGSTARGSSAQCHDRVVVLRRRAKEACMPCRIRPAMQPTEPIMKKQRKTTAKPVRQGTKAGPQSEQAVPAPNTKLGRLEGMLRRSESTT